MWQRVKDISSLKSPVLQGLSLIAQSGTGGRIFFPRIDDIHHDRIHSSLTPVSCFDKGYVGKQPVAWKEYFGEYWLKEL